jgi:hypothetical protein
MSIAFSSPTDSVTIRFFGLRTDNMGIDNIYVVTASEYLAHKGTCQQCPAFTLGDKTLPVEGFYFDQAAVGQIAYGETFDTNPSARGWDMSQGAIFDDSASAPKFPSTGSSTLTPGFLRLGGTGACNSDTVATSIRIHVTPNVSYVLTGWYWAQNLGKLFVSIDTDPQILFRTYAWWPLAPGLGGVHAGFQDLGVVAATPDGVGGLFIAAEHDRDVNPGLDVGLTHVDADGVLQADVTVATGTTVDRRPSIGSDGAGGAIVAWEDFRTGNADVYAQRFRPNSSTAWTGGGRAIAVAAAAQEWPRCAPDGAGGAIMVWDDLRLGPRRLYAQRVDPTGNLAWTTNGVPVCGQTIDSNDHALLSDGAHGAFFAWTDVRRGDRDVYVQHLDASGNPLWGANGAPACSLASNASHVTLTSDGSGGIVVGWIDDRSGAAAPNCFAQRFTASGQALWTTSGRILASGAGAQSELRSLAGPSGQTAFVWSDLRNLVDTDIYAQVLDGSGNPLWGSGGRAICQVSGAQTSPALTLDADGFLNLVWIDARPGTGTDAPFAQRVASDGTPTWSVDGVPLTILPSSDTGSPWIFGHPGNGTIVLFSRNVLGVLAALRLDRYGAVGDREARVIGLTDHPGDNGHALDLLFAPSEGDRTDILEIDHYDVEYESAPQVWTHAASVSAAQVCSQSLTVYSPVDSIVGVPTTPTRYRVVAVGSNGRRYESRPVSGFAIDDILPRIPDAFTWEYAGIPDGQGNRDIMLRWQWFGVLGGPPDLAGVRLYRSSDVFVPPPAGSFFVSAPSSSFSGDYLDADAVLAQPYYFLRLVDQHGNQSAALAAIQTEPIGVDPDSIPVVLFIGTPRPNPSAGAASLELALPRDEVVRIDCFDVAGRLVQARSGVRLPAGRHVLQLSPLDAEGRRMPAGLHFVRILIGTTMQTRRWVTL